MTTDEKRAFVNRPPASNSRRWVRSFCGTVALLVVTAPLCGKSEQLPRPTRADREEVASRQSVPWTSLGLGGGGGMFTPAFSPADPNSLLLNCDMSGVYRSTDGGKNWEMIHYRQLTSSTRVRPVWHPTETNVAFAAGRSGLKITYRSDDRGATWTRAMGSGIDLRNERRNNSEP